MVGDREGGLMGEFGEGEPRPGGPRRPIVEPPPRRKLNWSWLWWILIIFIALFGYWAYKALTNEPEQMMGPKKTASKLSQELAKKDAPVAPKLDSVEGWKAQAEDRANAALDAEEKAAKLAKELAKEKARVVKAQVEAVRARSEAAKAESAKMLAVAEARAKAIAEANEAADAAAKAADELVQRNLAAAGVITGGGGTSALENYRITGKVTSISPAPEACSKRGGPRYVDVTPRLEGNEVVLSGFSDCATLVDVELYDDVRGIPTRHLGAVTRFAIERGAGFNFVWRDTEGHRHYQMITPQSGRLLAGTGLEVDCSHSGGCKYVRP